MPLLEKLQKTSDVKSLNISELKELAKDIRQVILDTVLVNGGHLASNLGTVELSIALHYVFNAPYDKIIFDVGHQCYAHKLLTGRLGKFGTLRKMGGISGFPKWQESVYDVANTGHSSTSISVACGLTRALKLEESDNVCISVIGDGALTGGLAYEALNDATGKKQIIILNDNSMSISKNVGSTAQYLLQLHKSKAYNKLKSTLGRFVQSLKLRHQQSTKSFLFKSRNIIKYFMQGGLPFDQYAIKYFGPIDGHNFNELINAFEVAKNENDDNVLIHVVTQKGRGYMEAEKNPAKYHGVSSLSGAGGESFSDAFGKKLTQLAKVDKGITAITAAMASGTGLNIFAKNIPDRCYDVGIAEAHAVSMAAGLALGGFKPYFAVYSTFLQRAYDQVIHDVCLQKLPVTLCIDRSGIVPDDGETHQGIYDVGFLRLIPNMTVVAPMNTDELNKILEWSIAFNAPLAIRYPKGCSLVQHKAAPTKLGKWQTLNNFEKSDICLLAHGALMVAEAVSVSEILAAQGVKADVVNANFVKPLDAEFLSQCNGKILFTLEDNLLEGGFGSAVLEYCNAGAIDCKVRTLGIKNDPLEHGTVRELMEKHGLTAPLIVKRVLSEIR